MFYVILSYLFYPLVRLITALRGRREVCRILVVQTAKIGDVISATPVLRALARRFPEAHITVLANPVTRELLEGNPHADAVIALAPGFSDGFAGKWRLVRLVRAGRYDLAITLNPNVPFAVGLFLGLVPVRLSVMPNFAGSTFRLASGLFSHLATHRGDQLVLQTYFYVLKEIGVESSDFSKDVVKTPDGETKATMLLAGVKKPIVGVAVSSANKLKQLDAAKISRLVDALTKRHDLYAVLIGAKNDRQDADRVIAGLSDTAQVIDAVGKFTLRELPGLLERLSVFVGVDSGLTYMADACGTPIVQIAGPVNTLEQRPMGDSVVIIKRDLPCAPCSHVFNTVQFCKIKTRECIESVTPDEICDSVLLLLRKVQERAERNNAIS